MMNLKPVFRVLLFPIALSMAIAAVAFADDSNSKTSKETTHDVSKNPLTGNTTETTTTETKVKVGDASKTTKHVKKRKHNKDGTKVKEETEHNSEMHQ